MCTPVLAVWTTCAFNFFTKNPKNYHAFLIFFFTVLWYFTCSKSMEIICVNFSFDLCILCSCVNFLVRSLIQNVSCDVDVWALNFMMSLPLIVCLIHSIVLVDFFVYIFGKMFNGVSWFFFFLLLKILAIFSICVKFDLCLQSFV